MDGLNSITFAAGSLDRAAHLRGDEAALARLAATPEARVMALWRGKAAIAGDALAWYPLTHPLMAEAVEPPVFLGLEHGTHAPRFAIDVSGWEDPNRDEDSLRSFSDASLNRHPAMAEGEAFLDLRTHMAALDPVEAGNAATAKGIIGWHTTHRFCARCGAASAPSLAGWRRSCPACGAHHFPRTDPVVIMLITHGSDVLLGRSPGWPDGMYSLLAGFMEPGETIEDAVRREVWEEAAIPVGPVGYMASQPWPFPSSLMIGCWGEATAREITLDPVELDDAQWFSREAVRDAMAGLRTDMRPARKGAIARSLIEAWLAGRA